MRPCGTESRPRPVRRGAQFVAGAVSSLHKCVAQELLVPQLRVSSRPVRDFHHAESGRWDRNWRISEEPFRRFNHCVAPVPEALAMVVPEHVEHSSVLVLADLILYSRRPWGRGRQPFLKTIPSLRRARMGPEGVPRQRSATASKVSTQAVLASLRRVSSTSRPFCEKTNHIDTNQCPCRCGAKRGHWMVLSCPGLVGSESQKNPGLDLHCVNNMSGRDADIHSRCDSVSVELPQ